MSLYSKIIDIQKLQAAWRNVKKNKPARGVDDVTWEMFDNNIREELKQLNIELKNHEYHPFPVRMVNMYKEEKIRKIALFSMRDKVVQQATAQELTRIYDADFSENTYAYRPGKSALSAVKIIEDIVESGEYPWVVKLDVQHYFDEIPHKLLEKKLKQKIKEEDSLELIMYSATTPSLQEGGEVKEKTVGIYQGSIVSPILSNIYLNDLDHSFDGREIFYMRYADDILIAAKSKESAMQGGKEPKCTWKVLVYR
ncbi:group II intron-encoding maturase [Roseburia sp. CAG:303]|mgnify:FL=1|nr:group II intron-encoding maturase [Roseburia sp. CAG:303]